MIFLRPWWLIALLLPLLFWKIKKKNSQKNPWSNIIDKQLLKALTISTKIPFVQNTLSKLTLLLWGLCCIALAGPAWDKIPVPSAQMKQNTILILDLNKSLTPKQIQNIHIKLYDILTLLKEDRVALVLFGQSKGYTAMPLTPDTQLISNLIPSLIPSVLPEDAFNLKAGIQEAEKILNQTGQGRLLIISDKDVPSSAFQTISFNPEKDSLTQLADTLKTTTNFSTHPVKSNGVADVWYDRGIWLALLALIPACLLFRKNVIFLWLICGSVSIAEAGWFQREDQENYALNQKGIAAYRQQNYPKAEENFQKAKNPYNMGNALAYQGKIQEAITAYQEALKLNPKDEDAQFNKEYLEKQLSKDKNKSNSNQDQQKNKENQQQNSENSEEQKQDKNSQESQEEQAKNQEKPTKENQPTQDETQKELEQALAQEQNEVPFNQEEQQILNRLNKDPARVLRYRINLQHQRGMMS